VRKSLSMPRLKVLFVCGRNKRRSPTAEKIFHADPRMTVRAAGTGETSKRRLTEADLRWADVVFVMQRKYAKQINVRFGRLDIDTPVRSLEITDDYTYMDPELVSLLRTAVDHEFEAMEEERIAALENRD
jgi:predicted protein tyrosine phosphatase